jgi:hypothetical protein
MRQLARADAFLGFPSGFEVGVDGHRTDARNVTSLSQSVGHQTVMGKGAVAVALPPSELSASRLDRAALQALHDKERGGSQATSSQCGGSGNSR